MLDAIKSFILPPQFPNDENKTQKAKVIYYLLVTTLIVAFSCIIANIILYSEKTVNSILITGTLISLLIIYVFNQLGYLRLACFSYVTIFWSLGTVMLYLGSGVMSPELGLYIALTVITGVMLGVRWASALMILNWLVVLIFAILEIKGYPFPHYFPETPLVRWFNFSIFIILTIMPVHIILSGLSKALTKAKEENKFRKKAEEKILDSEKYFRALIENSQDIITVLNPDGKIRFTSPANERLLGYSFEEFTGKNIFNFIFPKDHKLTLNLIQQCLKKVGKSHAAEFRMKHKNGSLRHIDVTGQNLLHISEVKGIVINLRDITDRKILEGRLRQVEKMESIGRLAGGMVHDFNNILSTILGYTDMLLLNIDEKDPNKESVDVIKQATKQAINLTKQLLAFSSKQILTKEIISLDCIIKDFLNMLSKMLGKDIKIITHLNAEEEFIEADHGQIEQILMNLTINAKDAMSGKGNIIIETKKIEFDKDKTEYPAGIQAGKYVMLAVTDTGSGINKEIIEHIFDPFFTTKEKGKGTGLGLATVYGITKQHKGEIYVYSEEGKGTTFKIYLPLLDKPITKDNLHHKQTKLQSSLP